MWICLCKDNKLIANLVWQFDVNHVNYACYLKKKRVMMWYCHFKNYYYYYIELVLMYGAIVVNAIKVLIGQH